jgi:peptide/histidine transporter 3/4
MAVFCCLKCPNRWLDRAAVPVGDSEDDETAGLPVSAWRLCSVSQVEEVKMIIRVLPIWASTIVVWTALSQMETFSMEGGSTMDHQMGSFFSFPTASLSVFELINVMLILPLYDKLLVPYVRRFTGHPQGITMLQRIGVGLLFSIVTMLVAALVERRRVQVATEYGLLDKPQETIPMSMFWLIPQYFLCGSTEIFTQVGQLEFFYNEVPDRMRSLGSAIYLSTIACGHFLSTLLVTAVNRATQRGNNQGWLTDNLNRSRLDYFYLLLACLNAANFAFFLVCARGYKYKKVNRDSANPSSTLDANQIKDHGELKGDEYI